MANASPAPATQRTQLALAPHVRACQCNGQLILLDLLENRYLGVPEKKLPILMASLEGAASASAPRDEHVRRGQLVASLLHRGLLTDRLNETALQPSIDEATCSLDAAELASPPRFGGTRPWRLAVATLHTATALRLRTLHAIACRVSARRRRSSVPTDGVVREHLLREVAIYDRLRPFFYTKKDRCLFDSLVLLDFLAREDLYPHWVIGVRAAPFGAHSWVQAGPMVLNDLHERVRHYQPILVA